MSYLPTVIVSIDAFYMIAISGDDRFSNKEATVIADACGIHGLFHGIYVSGCSKLAPALLRSAR